MNASDWLARRSPAPTPELAAAISRALDESAASDAGVAEQLTNACAKLATRVVADGCEARSGALDLLTLDALMTYAMEAAAESSASTEQTASALLAMLADASA